MTTPQIRSSRQCTVYRGRGETDPLSTELAAFEPEPRHHPPIADRVPLHAIMPRDLVCARPDLAIPEVVGLMVRHRVGCIPVVDERRRPIGVITKLDLVEHLADAAAPPDLGARIAEDVMMPFALMLHEHATIAHAASMMTVEDTHHVLVINRADQLIGVVSTKDIVRWLVAR